TFFYSTRKLFSKSFASIISITLGWRHRNQSAPVTHRDQGIVPGTDKAQPPALIEEPQKTISSMRCPTGHNKSNGFKPTPYRLTA
ncbi:MAG: hypothetical protein ACQ9MH_25740, partial [Nitrospinales bacterium]